MQNFDINKFDDLFEAILIGAVFEILCMSVCIKKVNEKEKIEDKA